MGYYTEYPKDVRDKEQVLAWLRLKKFRYCYAFEPHRGTVEILIAEGKAEWFGGERVRAKKEGA